MILAVLCQNLVQIIDKFKQRQVKRIEHYKESTRRNKDILNKIQDSLTQMHSLCLAMDNYFILPNVIAALQENNIGVVRTSKFRRNWPSKDLTKIQQEKVDFNNFFYCVDDEGTLTTRWMEYGLIFCVPAIHRVDKIIQRTRKNKKHNLKQKPY